MSDNRYETTFKTTEEIRAAIQRRLDDHFADIGVSGENNDSGRTLVPNSRSDQMNYEGRTYEFRLNEFDSYVCVGSYDTID